MKGITYRAIKYYRTSVMNKGRLIGRIVYSPAKGFKYYPVDSIVSPNTEYFENIDDCKNYIESNG